jgi:Undecaprenyl-phosphate galactose phosphotransferase WbaP
MEMSVENLSKMMQSRYKHTSSFLSGIALMIVDSIVIMLCFGASFFIINFIDRGLINFKSFVTYWVYLPAFLAVFYVAKLYPGMMLSPADEVRRFAVAVSCCFIGIAISIEVETDDRGAIGVALLLAIPLASLTLPIGREIARKLFSKFLWWGVPAVVYCEDHQGQIIIDRLIKHPEYGYRPALIIQNTSMDNISEYRGIPVTMPSEQVHETIKKLGIKNAIVIESPSRPITGQPLGELIMNLFRYTIVIPNASMLTIAISVRDFGGILGFASTHNLTKPGNLFLKRLVDLTVLVISSPFVLFIVALTAILIKCTSKGPVFYGHKRIGKNGKSLKTWKFRTMVVDADKRLAEILESSPTARSEWAENQKLENDPRITPFGKFLRKTSMDELPQLWNILLGQMSFVGPRPVTEPDLEKYRGKANFILSVKPGLSGMWQISGRSDTGYEERIMLDSYYIQNWSIWLDSWIILRTVAVVIKGKGAY